MPVDSDANAQIPMVIENEHTSIHVENPDSGYNTAFFVDLSDISIRRAEEKPVAESLEKFFESPHIYRPRDEYLARDMYIDDETILTKAIKEKMIGVVKSLLELKCDPNQPSKKGILPISTASQKGFTDVMRLLMQAGCDVNAPNNTGSTALIQASHFGYKDAVELLLQHNALSDFANIKGTTALMRASQEGHLDISKALINADADVNKKNLEGMNALMLASQRGHANMALLLVKAGAAIDEQTSQGSTALMLACKRGHKDCVHVLVTMGSEVCMRDCRSRTARDTALRRNHSELLEFLDTQVQIRKIQELRRVLRQQLLLDLRSMLFKGKLCIRVNTKRSDGNVVSSTMYTNTFVGGACYSQASMAASTSSALSCITTLPSELCRSASNQNYHPSEWAYLLYKCMDKLPTEVFDLIVDMLPVPRLWQWTLFRLKRRCKLSPKVAITDISILMDEILCDSNIFNSRDQTNLLIRIAHNPQIRQQLENHCEMPKSLVDTLCTWSDVQSIVQRTNDSDIQLKTNFARKFLDAALMLFRWYRAKNNFAIESTAALLSDSGDNIKSIVMMEGEDMGELDEVYGIGGDVDTETEFLGNEDGADDDDEANDSDENVNNNFVTTGF